LRKDGVGLDYCHVVKGDFMIEIICILDRSGSMGVIKHDAIGSFNTFIEEQKKVPGEAVVTVVLFNHEYQALYEQKPLAEVPVMTEEIYQPTGTTALLHAVCRTLEAPEKAERGIVVILTDGQENASPTEYTKERVAKAVKALEDKGWQVLFLAADQDAFAEGAALGISHAANYVNTSGGIQKAYAFANANVASYRTGSYPPHVTLPDGTTADPIAFQGTTTDGTD
jgi:hypothetical protein